MKHLFLERKKHKIKLSILIDKTTTKFVIEELK